MTIYYRTDSDGVVHQVWAQRQAASCAVASIWMARNKAKRMTFAETEWALAWRLYHKVVKGYMFAPSPSAPMTFDPGAHQPNQQTMGNMFSRFGTFMGQVAQLLRTDGLRVTTTPWSPGIKLLSHAISDTTPAIVLLGWYRGAHREAGHFIVAARRTQSGKIVYLDPWGGVLRELGVGPSYPPNGRFEQIAYISA